ncbi:MAG TPA: hypothetical protein VH165_04160 [Kofleriaceae bacterium]|nr:hypothetical protein [Kofleriaceae bacterium]
MEPVLIDLPETLETEHLILRPPRAGDGAAVNAAILGDLGFAASVDAVGGRAAERQRDRGPHAAAPRELHRADRLEHADAAARLAGVRRLRDEMIYGRVATASA